MLRKLRIFFLLLLFLIITVRYANAVFIFFENDQPSESIGEVNNGRLKNGKRLPLYGNNFRCASWLMAALGRNAVHDKVRGAMLETYKQLEEKNIEWQFVYGETGWPRGGKFWPHKTHQNGMSVDFMVPVKTRDNKIADFTTNIFNRWGYAVDFDHEAKTPGYVIDFEAAAAHLDLLEKSAKSRGLKIVRVIFDVDYHSMLFKAGKEYKLEKRMHFPLWKPWVRHDDHYHVDFEKI